MDQPGNHILLRGKQSGAADRMRELLARTVQDHVADQRSNAGALEDIRQRMEGLEWLVKEVREREIPGLAARLDGLAGHLDQAAQTPPAWAESLAEHIELLRAQVTPLAELHSLWPELGTVVGTVAQNVEQALPQLQSVGEGIRAQDERMAKLQQNMTKLQQSMEAAAGRFSRLDKAVAELSQRTAQLDKEMSAVKGRAEAGFGAVTAKLEQTAEAMTGIGGQVDVLGGQVQVVHGRIERLDERLADTDDKLGSLDGKLTAADAKLGSAGDRVAALDTKLERLDERLDDQYDRVSVIGKGLVSVDQRLAGQDEVTDAVAKVVDAAQGEVTGRIASLEETVLTLAEALLRPQASPREGTRI